LLSFGGHLVDRSGGFAELVARGPDSENNIARTWLCGTNALQLTLECGGKRCATPLLIPTGIKLQVLADQKRHRRFALPSHSKNSSARRELSPITTRLTVFERATYS
jgi:hypothetical protein